MWNLKNKTVNQQQQKQKQTHKYIELVVTRAEESGK